MTSYLELQTFYKNIPGQSPSVINSDIGHFNIFKIEDIVAPKNKQPAYSRRSFYKVSLITGHNKLHYADKCIEIKETALVFTNPMIPYKWERISEEQSGYFCIFTEPFINQFGNVKDLPVFQFTDASIIPLKTEEVSYYKGLFLKMFEEVQSDYIYKYDLLRHLLMGVVHSAQKRQRSWGNIYAGNNASERIASIFMELLERQFPIELAYQTVKLNSPSAFAKQLNIHVNHLNKALKEITGQTTSQLIDNRILQEARILLKSTSWSIGEVAWGLGYEEPNHFSSFFKSKTKLTPNQFRQSSID
ncbi:MAG TPA: AraC family transcriptional regulator [Mucilaginibacter sp.]